MFRGPGGEPPGELASRVPVRVMAKVRRRATEAAERQRVLSWQLAAAHAEAAAAGGTAEEVDATVTGCDASSLSGGGEEGRRPGRRPAVRATGSR